VEELEMLLEAYFVVVDGTLNKLTSLKEYIDDTEDFINIQLVSIWHQNGSPGKI
jgi:magnesium transporter